MQSDVNYLVNLHYTNNPSWTYQPVQHDMMAKLEIVEQPVKQHRFRYTTENGNHGSLMGRNRDKSKSFPKIKISDYTGIAEIVVSLSALNDSRTNSYIRHVHMLKGKKCTNGIFKTVENISGSKEIELNDIHIEHIAKRDIKTVLREQYENYFKSQYGINYAPEQHQKEIQNNVETYASILGKKLNVVYLCIEAYVGGTKDKLCGPIFSDPISNQKATQTNQLKICRKDRCSCPARGNEEMFILCEKVDKKNIQVRFYEEDGDWEAFGKFGELDVHHQFAIVLRIPPYKDTKIQEEVLVKLELYRPSDSCRSESEDFWYTPDPDLEHLKRKRQRTEAVDRNYNEPPGQREPSTSRKFLEKKPRGLHVNTQKKPSSNNDQEQAPPTADVLDGCLDLQNELNMKTCPEGATSQFSYILEGIQSIDQMFHPNASIDDPMLSSTAVDISQDQSHTDNLFTTSEIDWDPVDLFDVVTDSPKKKTSRSPDIDLSNLDIESDAPKKKESELKFSVCSQKLVSRGTDRKEDKKYVDLQSDSVTYVMHNTSQSLEFESFKTSKQNDTGYKLLYQLAVRTASALQKYAKSSSIKFLLETMGHLIAIQDENGDNSIHNAVIHANNESTALYNLVEIAEQTPNFDPLNIFNNRIQTPLHIAVHVDSSKMVKALINHGADPNLCDRHGNGALHLACLHGKYDIVKTLLDDSNYQKKDYHKNKPTLSCFNYDGYAPLHLAVLSGCLSSVKVLCISKADVNLPDHNNGKTPIHLAVEKMNSEILKELLKHEKADANIQTYNGYSPLHLACSLDAYEIVHMLLEANADPYLENYDNQREESSDEDDSNIKKNLDVDSEEIHGCNSFDIAKNNSKIMDLLFGKMPCAKDLKSEAEDKLGVFAPNSSQHLENHRYPIISDNSMLSSLQLNDPAQSTPPNKITQFKKEMRDSLDTVDLTTDHDIPEENKKNLDSGIALSEIDMMDGETKLKLASLLDPRSDKDWEHLAKILDYGYLCSIIEKTTSPTVTLLSYISGIAELRQGLQALELQQAMDIVDDYLKGQGHATSDELHNIGEKFQNLNLNP